MINEDVFKKIIEEDYFNVFNIEKKEKFSPGILNKIFISLETENKRVVKLFITREIYEDIKKWEKNDLDMINFYNDKENIIGNIWGAEIICYPHMNNMLVYSEDYDKSYLTLIKFNN